MTTDLLIVGFDGLDPKLVDRWHDSLPTISKLLSRGSNAKLESTIPTVTGVAWPSITTGKLPAKTGITHFEEDDDIVNRSNIQSKTLWELLSDAGREVAAVGVPGSYPPDPIDGAIVTSIFTPSLDNQWIHPPELANEVPEPIFDTGHAPLPDLLAGINRRDEINEVLLDDRDWDVYFTVYMESDRAGHSLLTPTQNDVEGYDDLKKVYERLDESLASLEERADADNVILLSDHGYGRVPRKRFNVIRWLSEEGYIDKSIGNQGRFTKEKIERILDQYDVVSHVPDSVKRFGKRYLPSERDAGTSSDVHSAISYEEMWMNGAFDVPHDDPEITARLVDDLESLKDPETDQRIFTEVVNVQEDHEGPFLDRLPTVLARFHPNIRAQPTVGTSLVDDIPTNAVESDHRFRGVLVGAGTSFATSDGDEWTSTAHVTDILPTVLHLVDVPIPKDCDGTVHTEFLAEESAVSERDIKLGPSSELQRQKESTENEEVRDRLEDLGYL